MASIVSAGTTSATALNLSADTTGILQLASNNGTVALTVGTTQNVGIGTTGPSRKLVVSNAGAQGFEFGAGVGGGSGNELLNYNRTTGLYVPCQTYASEHTFYSNTGGTALNLFLASSGNVGIGTTTPNANAGSSLVVYDGTAPRIRLTNSTTGQAAGDGAELSLSGSDFYIENRESQNIVFYSGSERGRFDPSGNFLVGSASTSGSVGNYAAVLGGVFKSFSGQTASTASGTYVTLFTASSGTISSYLVTVWISADDVNNYQANVIVNTQAGSSTKVSVIVAGSLLQFQMSGYALQARQNSGGSAPISYSAMRISA